MFSSIFVCIYVKDGINEVKKVHADVHRGNMNVIDLRNMQNIIRIKTISFKLNMDKVQLVKSI